MQINVSFNFRNATDLSWEMNLISVSDDRAALAEQMPFVGTNKTDKLEPRSVQQSTADR